MKIAGDETGFYFHSGQKMKALIPQIKAKLYEINELFEKAGRIDHIWPVRLILSYISKQQAFNNSS